MIESVNNVEVLIFSLDESGDLVLVAGSPEDHDYVICVIDAPPNYASAVH